MGSTLRWVELASQIRYKDWEIAVGEDACGYCGQKDRNYLQVSWRGPCTTTGETKRHTGRKWRLSET